MTCCPATIPTVKTKMLAATQAATEEPPALEHTSTLPMQRGFSVTSNTSIGSGISLLSLESYDSEDSLDKAIKNFLAPPSLDSAGKQDTSIAQPMAQFSLGLSQQGKCYAAVGPAYEPPFQIIGRATAKAVRNPAGKKMVKTTPNKNVMSENSSVMSNATPATQKSIKNRQRIKSIYDGVDGSQHSERREERLFGGQESQTMVWTSTWALFKQSPKHMREPSSFCGIRCEI